MRLLLCLMACLIGAQAASSAAEVATMTIPAPQSDEATAHRVRRLLPPHVGCAVLVVGENTNGERVVFKQGYGYRGLQVGPDGDIEAFRVTTATNFCAGSLTKVFTSAAILKLADEGRLKLDDRLDQWLTDLPPYASKITLEQLLTHRSGLPDYRRLMNKQAPPHLNDLTALRMIAAFPRPEFPAGTRRLYCDTNYVLLGLVAQQASGRPFHTYLRDEVLGPFGMTGSAVLVEGLNAVPRRAYGARPGPLNEIQGKLLEARRRQLTQMQRLHDQRAALGQDATAIDVRITALQAEIDKLTRVTPPKALIPPGLDVSAWHAADRGPFDQLAGVEGLYTSVDDLHRFVESLQERSSVLSDAGYERWFAPASAPEAATPDAGEGRRYTRGWLVDRRLGEPRYSHRGSVTGFSQTLQWMPESGRAVAVLMNSVPPGPNGADSWDDSAMQRLGEQVLQTVLEPVDEASGLEQLPAPIELRRPADAP